MPVREAGTLDHFGMTAKKSHEVKRMADMVHQLAKNRGVQQVGKCLWLNQHAICNISSMLGRSVADTYDPR